MAATRSSAQINPGTGDALELVDVGLGVKTPTTLVKGSNPSGNPVDLIATAAGALKIDLDVSTLATTAKQDSLKAAVDAVATAVATAEVAANADRDAAAAVTATAAKQDAIKASIDATILPDLLVSKVLTSTAFTATGTMVDLNNQAAGELVVAMPAGYSTFSVRKAAGSGTVIFESSFTGDVWDSIYMGRVDAQAAAGLQTGVTTSYETWVGDIPGGTKFVRARASVISGTVTVRVGLSTASYDPTPSVYVGGGSLTAAISASNNVIGNTRKAGVWYDESSTLPAANGVITGASRDLTGALTGAQMVGNGQDRFEAKASYSHPGTLYVETSKDNVTWFREYRQDTALLETGGRYIAGISVSVTERYARAVFVNGATAATSAKLTTKLLS